MLGFSLLWMRRHDEALAETERAVALGPNSSQARVYHALTLAFSDRAADGLPQAEAACFSRDGRSIYVCSEQTRRWMRYDRE